VRKTTTFICMNNQQTIRSRTIRNPWWSLFLLAAAVQLAVEAAGWLPAEFWVKPLLMPLLMAAVWRANPRPFTRSVQLLLLGLFLSWLGDVFLLPWPGRGFFLWGLASFLLAHLCYIAAFWQWPDARIRGMLRKKPWVIFPFLILLAGLLSWLWPGLGPGLKVPVSLYAGILVAMVLSGLHISELMSRPHAYGLLAGAMLFLLSDALLAAGRFGPSSFSLPALGFWVMLTYMAGQAGIALGLSYGRLSERA